MKFTEQIAFLAGIDRLRERVVGTEAGFDSLVDAVTSDIAGVH
jgi:hypothetical protein